MPRVSHLAKNGRIQWEGILFLFLEGQELFKLRPKIDTTEYIRKCLHGWEGCVCH